MTGQPIELVRPLMESLETDLLPREPDEAPRLYGLRPHRFKRAVDHALAEWETHGAAGRAMKVEREIRNDAAPQRVYDVVMDPSRLEDWVTIHHQLVDSPNGSLKKGSRLTQCLKLAGTKFNVHWTVVENDPCKRVVWEGRGPVAPTRGSPTRSATPAPQTNFPYMNEYDLPGGPLGRIAGKASRE